jgi:hypothetical protein
MTNLKIVVPLFILTLKINSPIGANRVCDRVCRRESSFCNLEVDSELVASDFTLTTASPGSNIILVSAMITNNAKDLDYTDLYVVFKGPDKKLQPIEGFVSGNLLTKQDGNIKYSAKLPFSEKATRTVKITISLNPSGNSYQPGDYQMDIYEKGEKIGTGHFHLFSGVKS